MTCIFQKWGGSKMTKAWKLLASTLVVTLALPALAAPVQQVPPQAPSAAVPGYTMPSTQVWEITSDSGELYRIFVSYPATAAPKEGFPVLYVLDGNAMFAGFAETRRIQEASDVGKSIIVGVGYPTDQAYDTRRLYDLTGAPPPRPWRDAFAKVRNGGWDKFLDFLTVKLRAEVGKRYKIDLDRQALFGHSLGGLFAVHTLFSRPGSFHAIIAASPSLFWQEQEMLKEERDFTTRLQAGKIPSVSRLMGSRGIYQADRAPLRLWVAHQIRNLCGRGAHDRAEPSRRGGAAFRVQLAVTIMVRERVRRGASSLTITSPGRRESEAAQGSRSSRDRSRGGSANA
jgi:predicted alpha/beta superfamily hydrolase